MIEDRLSDALNAALTQRFVDRRRAALHRRLKSGSDVMAVVNAANEVIGNFMRLVAKDSR